LRKSAEFPGTEKNKTTEREDNDVWEKRTIVIVSLAVLAVIAVLALCLNPGAKAGPSLQTTDTVLMVSPVAFGYNEETAVNNVIAVEDTKKPHTPDSVFPNNWFSTHDDGTLVLYPMFAENRRLERKPAALEAIEANFDEKRTVDLTHYEEEGLFLEGTGSMVLDRVNKIAYACESPRTNKTVLNDFCEQLGYTL